VGFGKPKKRFSQNFLVDHAIAEQIVSFLNLNSEDTVFEIGTGRGILTEIIAQTGARLFSFEIDRDLMPQLKDKFSKYESVNIINCDFLSVAPSEYHKGAFKLIGNIPYDITSPLLDWMIKYRKSISLAVITAQEELAERISSCPGEKRWAPISIFSQSFFDIKIVLHISPKSFLPPPKVKSAVMIFNAAEKYRIANQEQFEKVVRLAFRHRWKLLINNLTEALDVKKEYLCEILDRLNFDRNIRAEQIDIDGFIRLADALPNIS